jgi:uncharacterized protein (TIGR02001 family)
VRVTFGESGFSGGAWASNVDFDNDEDLELDLYINYGERDQRALHLRGGGTYYDYRSAAISDGYPEFYIGATWQLRHQAVVLGRFLRPRRHRDVHRSQLHAAQSARSSRWLSTWVIRGMNYWKNTVGDELVDYACKPTTRSGNLTAFAKFTGNGWQHRQG